MYKNMFFFLLDFGVKKNYLIVVHLLFQSTLHDCSETGFLFVVASNKNIARIAKRFPENISSVVKVSKCSY